MHNSWYKNIDIVCTDSNKMLYNNQQLISKIPQSAESHTSTPSIKTVSIKYENRLRELNTASLNKVMLIGWQLFKQYVLSTVSSSHPVLCAVLLTMVRTVRTFCSLSWCHSTKSYHHVLKTPGTRNCEMISRIFIFDWGKKACMSGREHKGWLEKWINEAFRLMKNSSKNVWG